MHWNVARSRLVFLARHDVCLPGARRRRWPANLSRFRSPHRLLAPTAQIVSSRVGDGKPGAAEPPGPVQAVHRALAALGRVSAEAEPTRPTSAVSVRRSVHPGAFTCSGCGVRFEATKRRLTARDLHAPTPFFRAHVKRCERFEPDMRARIAALA